MVSQSEDKVKLEKLTELDNKIEELISEHTKLLYDFRTGTRLSKVNREIKSIEDKINFNPMMINPDDQLTLENLKKDERELEQTLKQDKKNIERIQKEIDQLFDERRKLLIDEKTIKQINQKIITHENNIAKKQDYDKLL